MRYMFYSEFEWSSGNIRWQLRFLCSVEKGRANSLIWRLYFPLLTCSVNESNSRVSVTGFCSEVILAHILKGTDGKCLAVMPLHPLTSWCSRSFLTVRARENGCIFLWRISSLRMTVAQLYACCRHSHRLNVSAGRRPTGTCSCKFHYLVKSHSKSVDILICSP